MFFLIVFTVWATVLAHIFWRSRQLLRPGRKVAIALGLSMFALGFMYVPGRILMVTGTAQAAGTGLGYLGVVWIGYATLLWTLLVMVEIGGLIAWAATRGRVRVSKMPRGAGIALWSAAFLLSAIGFFFAHSTPDVTRMQVTVPGLQAKHRVLFLADTHIGSISSTGQWEKTLAAARELQPEAILIAGDLIEDPGPDTEPKVSKLRETFPETPVYAVVGNHETYAGLDFFLELCKRQKIRVLRQETVELVPGLLLGGIDDTALISQAEGVRKMAAPDGRPLFLLAHRPSAALEVQDRKQSLVLAGHTHGGQIPPFQLFSKLGNSGFLTGSYDVGKASLYVTNGAGVWGPPMRLLAPPEIVEIEIEPGPVFKVRR